MTNEYQTIPVKPETKKSLDELGSFGESYDELIKKIIKFYKEKKKI